MSDQTTPTPEPTPTPAPGTSPATPSPAAQTTAPQPATPQVATGAGAAPPAATAPGTAQPPSGGGPFKSGKQKTIAMIVAGVVVVGGIGGLVGAMAGGGGDDKALAAPGEGGSGILNPTPVGNTNPAPEETTEPTEPTPQPTDAAPPPPPAGDGVSLGGVATIPLPSGWSVLGESDTDALLTDDQNTWVYAVVGQQDPSTDAGAFLSQVVPQILPSENYSQLQLGEVAPIQPFGSMVSAAVVDYQALWVDSQGSMSLYGQLYVAIRQDGSSLIMTAEHTPPEEFEQSYSSWGPVIDGAFQAFASN